MSALSNVKEQRIKNQFTHRARLFYKHDQYSMMYTAYHVPAEGRRMGGRGTRDAWAVGTCHSVIASSWWLSSFYY